MKTKFLFAHIFVLSLFSVSNAQVVSLVQGTSTISTSTQKAYKLPKEGVRIKFSDANFSFFPDSITNPLGDRKIFVVSRKWQTACLYDEDGNKHIFTKEEMVATTTTQVFVGKPFCIQTATGKKDLPTEIGLYNIQTKYGKNYKSTFYTPNGEKPDKPDQGAPMPFAMHFGRIIGQDMYGKLIYDYSDGSALHEKQTFNKQGALPFVSHGCIAVERGMGQTLQKVMTYGDLILVISENIPTSTADMISIYK